WTDSLSKDMAELSANKADFFSDDDKWYVALKNNALSLWKTSGDKAFKWVHWSMLGTFYEELFRRNDGPGRMMHLEEQTGVTPSSIMEVLQTNLASLDMNSDTPLVDIVAMDS
ncbi:hypothetical protein C0992_008720, partial [Termitomyces sp. T32_za158]